MKNNQGQRGGNHYHGLLKEGKNLWRQVFLLRKEAEGGDRAIAMGRWHGRSQADAQLPSASWVLKLNLSSRWGFDVWPSKGR